MSNDRIKVPNGQFDNIKTYRMLDKIYEYIKSKHIYHDSMKQEWCGHRGFSYNADQKRST